MSLLKVNYDDVGGALTPQRLADFAPVLYANNTATYTIDKTKRYILSSANKSSGWRSSNWYIDNGDLIELNSSTAYYAVVTLSDTTLTVKGTDSSSTSTTQFVLIQLD